MIKEFDHPEHCWKWTPLEVEYLNKKFSEKDALLRQALEALEKVENDLTYHGIVNGDAVDAAIQSIKQHLGEA